MNLSDETLEQLGSALSSCELLLTPNKRLAQLLTDVAADLLLPADSSSHSVALLPRILPFQQWVEQLYSRAALLGSLPANTILSAAEERSLWRELVGSHPQWPLDSVLASTIADFQQAGIQLDEALVDIESERFSFESLPDTRLFLACARDFKKELQKRSLITQSGAARSLAGDAVQSLTRPNVALVGFTRVNALQRALLEKFSNYTAADSGPKHIALRSRTEKRAQYRADDPEAELQQALLWALGRQRQHPQQRVAVVLGDLAQRRLQVQRIAQQLLVESGDTNGLDSSGILNHFNISAGAALAQAPLVMVLRKLVDSFSRPIPIDDWCMLFNQPYLVFAGEERSLAIRLLQAMYASGETEFRFTELSNLLDWSARGKSPEPSPQLLLQLNAEIRALHKRSGERRLPSEWIDELLALVEPLGWPALNTLQSVEYQQYQALLNAREQFARFNPVHGKISMSQSVAMFFNLCRDTVFHAETPVEQPVVQVLGLLEAAGQCFDAAWIAGMDETRWPMQASPNPFIPLSLQIAHSMPAASIDGELDYARKLSEEFRVCATEVVVSYCETVDDVQVGLSRLFAGEFATPFEFSGEGIHAGRQQPVAQEWINDSAGTRWQLEPGDDGVRRLPGGTNSLRLMANNPLQSYAILRLGIEARWPVQPGIRAYERGNIVHAVLESVWQAMPGSESLKKMSDADRRSLLAGLVVQQLERQLSRRYRSLPEKIVSLEATALVDTLAARLDFELRGTGFTVVEMEKAVELALTNCTVNARIDRVDEVQLEEQPRHLVVDYKTSNARANWLQQPLYEPQLPAYVLALQQQGSFNPRGLMLAVVRPGYIANRGLLADEELAAAIPGAQAMQWPEDEPDPGDENRWAALLQLWEEQLETLADQLLQGCAGFDPELHSVDERYRAFTRGDFAVLDDDSEYRR